jgi:hypothetical protein
MSESERRARPRRRPVSREHTWDCRRAEELNSPRRAQHLAGGQVAAAVDFHAAAGRLSVGAASSGAEVQPEVEGSNMLRLVPRRRSFRTPTGLFIPCSPRRGWTFRFLVLITRPSRVRIQSRDGKKAPVRRTSFGEELRNGDAVLRVVLHSAYATMAQVPSRPGIDSPLRRRPHVGPRRFTVGQEQTRAVGTGSRHHQELA